MGALENASHLKQYMTTELHQPAMQYRLEKQNTTSKFKVNTHRVVAWIFHPRRSLGTFAHALWWRRWSCRMVPLSRCTRYKDRRNPSISRQSNEKEKESLHDIPLFLIMFMFLILLLIVVVETFFLWLFLELFWFSFFFATFCVFSFTLFSFLFFVLHFFSFFLPSFFVNIPQPFQLFFPLNLLSSF